ncbi:MAG: hypothetical protein JSV09_11775, partial [Thermoplasmata archaeon]
MSGRVSKRLQSLILIGILVSASFLVLVSSEVSASPSFGTPEISPEYPNATEPVDVTIEINDVQEITNATLYYSYDGITWYNTTMTLDGGGGNIFFNETFPTTSFNWSNWASTSGSPQINTDGSNEPSPPYSLDLDGSGDYVYSNVIDISSYTNVNITFSYEMGGAAGGGGERPDPGDWLYLYYWNDFGSWITLWSQNGDGNWHDTFEQVELALPSDAYHSGFRFRFRSTGSGSNTDDFFVDDIKLFSLGEANGTIPGPGYSTWVYYYVNATNQIGETSESTIYSYYADGTPPVVVNWTSDPGPISSEENITIFTNVKDDHYLDHVLLWYDNGSGWSSIMMNLVSGNFTNATYQGDIPPCGSETTVSYYIEVFDKASNSNDSIVENCSTNFPPIITNVIHIPQYPNGTFSVTVYANISDSDGISSVTLYYSTDGAVYIPILMNFFGNDIYNCTIPATGSTTTVYYYIIATDNNNISNSPFIFTYYVDAEKPDFETPQIDPQYPNATIDVNVTVSITDNLNVTNATLWFSYNNIDWYSITMQGSTGFGEISNIALFQNTNPWGHTSNQDILNTNGISYTMYSASDIGSVDLSGYDKVIISSVQDYPTFYSYVEANKAWFESYVTNGGLLEIHGCDQGGDHWDIMPGDITHVHFTDNFISIIETSH